MATIEQQPQSAAQHGSAEYGPVLVGMRGSGKSSVAPLLARQLGMQWIDADPELERHHGRTIPQIFAEDGEPGFRKLERELLLGDLLRRERTVVATGGGAVLHPAVREALRGRATVWLNAPVHRLAARIAGSDRPSLTGNPIEQELRQVLQQREPLYREVARLIVDAGELGVDEVVSEIGQWVGQGGPRIEQ